MEESNCVDLLEHIAAIHDTYNKQMDELKELHDKQMKELKELNAQMVAYIHQYYELMNKLLAKKDQEIALLRTQNVALSIECDTYKHDMSSVQLKHH